MSRPGFYAVRIGRVPGIYYDHDTYMQQMEGFPYAQGKKFNDEDEAWEYLYEKADVTEAPDTDMDLDTSDEEAAGDDALLTIEGDDAKTYGFKAKDDANDDALYQGSKHYKASCACVQHSCEVGRGLIFDEMSRLKKALKQQYELLSLDMDGLVRNVEDILGEDDGVVTKQVLEKRRDATKGGSEAEGGGTSN